MSYWSNRKSCISFFIRAAFIQVALYYSQAALFVVQMLCSAHVGRIFYY